MKNTFLGISVLSLILGITGCAPITNLRLDDYYSAQTNKIQYELMPSGNVVKAYTCTDSIKGITYIVGVSDNNQIIYISTRDSTFKMGGMRVNMPVGNLLKSDQLRYASGWGYFVPVKNDWYAGLDYKDAPTEDSPILYFFQYRFGK